MKRSGEGQPSFEGLLEGLEAPEGDTAIHLPEPASTAALLAVARRHTPGAIEASGLSERVAGAQAEVEARLAEAATALAPLGVTPADLRRLAERALGRGPRVLPGAPGHGPGTDEVAGSSETVQVVTGDEPSPGSAGVPPACPDAGGTPALPGAGSVTRAELIALLNQARQAGRKAARERYEELQRKAKPGDEAESWGGALLILEADGREPLGKLLRGALESPLPNARVSPYPGIGFTVQILDMVPNPGRAVNEAAAEAALAVLKAGLGAEGYVSGYDE